MNYQYRDYCPRCQIGRLKPGKATYLRLHNNSILALPDTLAFICDVCHFQEFDALALRDIWALIASDMTENAEADDDSLTSDYATDHTPPEL